MSFFYVRVIQLFVTEMKYQISVNTNVNRNTGIIHLLQNLLRKIQENYSFVISSIWTFESFAFFHFITVFFLCHSFLSSFYRHFKYFFLPNFHLILSQLSIISFIFLYILSKYYFFFKSSISFCLISLSLWSFLYT